MNKKNKEFLKEEFNLVQVIKIYIMSFATLLIVLGMGRIIDLLAEIRDLLELLNI